MTYTVTNIYGIAGESRHRTPEAALKRAAGLVHGAGEGANGGDRA